VDSVPVGKTLGSGNELDLDKIFKNKNDPQFAIDFKKYK